MEKRAAGNRGAFQGGPRHALPGACCRLIAPRQKRKITGVPHNLNEAIRVRVERILSGDASPNDVLLLFADLRLLTN
jgi:hypothetical protein